MNTVSLKKCTKLDSWTVISKYFASSAVMDDSTSDFQQKKTVTKGPRNIKKSSKGLTKKPVNKRQNNYQLSKKNDLLSYTKRFDKVCKETGIDVDPDQLQLAVALSKSLQDIESPEVYQKTKSHTKLGIKRNLREYGFIIPDTKVINRKKKHKLKSSKLILLTDLEKQQIISDRYSCVLLQNAIKNNKQFTDINLCDGYHNKLFSLSANTSYKDMQNNNIFYVNDLIEKTDSKGILLRDWSVIPGRPQSPQHLKSNTMSFSEIECSQEELDKILSGTVKVAKDIIQAKVKMKYQEVVNSSVVEAELHEDNDLSFNNKVFHSPSYSINYKISERANSNPPDPLLVVANNIRSESPDIFDDDDGSILLEDNVGGKVEEKRFIEIKTASVVDLTQCYDKICSEEITEDIKNCKEKPTDKVKSQIFLFGSNCVNSQTINNLTQRKSNDFMEMTSCVRNEHINFNNQNLETCNENFIDDKLSQGTKILANDFMDLTECVIKKDDVLHKDLSNIELNIDLTQSSDGSHKNIDDEKKETDTVEISQSDSHEELPLIQLTGNDKVSQDDTILLDDYEICNAVSKSQIIKYSIKEVVNINNKLTDEGIKNNSIKGSQSFFDDYVFDHSEEGNVIGTSNAEQKEIDLTQSSNEATENSNDLLDRSSLGKMDNVSIDYDDVNQDIEIESKANTSRSESEREFPSSIASQLSNNDSDIFEICDEELNYSINKSRKCNEYAWDNNGDISIIDNVSIVEEEIESKNLTLDLPAVNIYDKNDIINKNNVVIEDIKNIEKNVNSTPKSKSYIIKTDQVTPMSDYASMSTPERNKELNKYGLKPFKRKRAIQLLTHIYNQTHPVVEPYMQESVNKKQKQEIPASIGTTNTKDKEAVSSLSKTAKDNVTVPSTTITSSIRSRNTKVKVTDPSSSITGSVGSLKTKDKVTDLSPCITDSVGPLSIKDIVYVPSSSVTSSISPKDTKDKGTVPNKMAVVYDEKLYEVTRDLPDIKDIECDEDEWVFQKREKSKIHSCRVPLHIAFHNYVSCRQRLREAILRYEPINIDSIYKGLVADGYRYHPKDLLKYMDKKCITVKTSDKNSRNNHR